MGASERATGSMMRKSPTASSRAANGPFRNSAESITAGVAGTLLLRRRLSPTFALLPALGYRTQHAFGPGPLGQLLARLHSARVARHPGRGSGHHPWTEVVGPTPC